MPLEIASLPIRADSLSELPPLSQHGKSNQFTHSQAKLWALSAGLTALAGILCFLIYGVFSRTFPAGSWLLFSGVLLTTTSLVLAATGHLRNPVYGPLAMGDVLDASHVEPPADKPIKSSQEIDGSKITIPAEVLRNQLVARGTETRLGEALRFVIEKEQGGPIAGIVAFTDGNSNAGLKPEIAAQLAHESKIPLYMVGLGSAKEPVNVGIAELQAPPRVFPGDDFTLTGFLHAHGLEGRTVRVQLYSAADRPDIDMNREGELEDERQVRLLEDGKLASVRFEVTPSETGRRIYQLRVRPPARDQNQRDNQEQSLVRVVERKNKVLLAAGGPTREYRFVRNLLYRDDHTQVDVLLQTSRPGISQEADHILFDFPNTPQEMFQYDAMLAFDVDWNQVERHGVELLERWIAHKAGGLILVAGPVHTPSWSLSARGNARLDTIKALHPVVFYGPSGASFHLSRVESARAWPLEFTTEGHRAEFLWLDDTSLASERVWSSFPGVYGFFAAKSTKPGAQVYARFSDPQSSASGELPVYLAGHFYGAGRVFYMASGEMWRLRSLDESYFEQFYTKLIRYVSQSRLLRDSNRGLLLVEQERCLVGETVNVRTVLSDPQHRPLVEPEVAGWLVAPDGIRQSLDLVAGDDATREGIYTGQFSASLRGSYRVELPIPDSPEDEVLVREVQVRLPDREVHRPQRNDPVLKRLAQKSDGAYYVGMEAVLPPGRMSPLVGQIPPQDQITYVPGAPDKNFDRALMSWLLVLIGSTLSMEWLLRRLHKLA